MAGPGTHRARVDAVVVGAGPNGLTAAAVLARAGRSVLVLERNERVGGGASTSPLTLPGFVHDDCSAVHPLGAASPAFRSLGLNRFGLRWCDPPLALAHPFDDGSAAVLDRSVEVTAASLGDRRDGDAYRALVGPLVDRFPAVVESALGPLVPVPRHPLVMARFGLAGGLPVTTLARRTFRGERGRALLAGLSAHSCIRLDHPLTAGLGLVLGLAAHVDGWPVAAGGSQAIADALAACVTASGGEIRTGHEVRSLADLPASRVVLCDVTPRQLQAMTDRPLTRRLRRWRYGAGVCKADYALAGPMPWTAEAARRAGTLHLGGTLAEIAAGEAAAASGRLTDRPYVLVAQPTVADPSRAPAGRHVLWAYVHVPHGSAVDATAAMEAQFDRFAPGWRDLVLARAVRRADQAEARNPNEVGGDIAGGALDGTQMVLRARYRTPVEGVYLCSSSTAPGAGVHGMCGWHAARLVLRRELR